MVPAALVRDATPADLAAIVGLYNALIPSTTYTYREELADAAELGAWFDAQIAAGFPVLVAELDDRVVGYTAYSTFRGGTVRAGYVHTAELTIHVDGGYHGRGIGRALMHALCEAGRARGLHVLVAGIDATNTGSIDFHRRLGFTETARMPEVGRKFGQWLTLVLMQRTID